MTYGFGYTKGYLFNKWRSAASTLALSLFSTTATFAAASQPYSMASDPFVATITPTVAKGLDGSFDYYIDATNGSDGNAGTSEGAAWASLNKLNAVSYSGSTSYRVLVKSDTYDTANDFVLVALAITGVTLEIVFEPGCVIDGTNYSTANAFSFDAPAADRTNTFRVYGNGLIVQNVTTATGNGWAPLGGVNEIYDVYFDNCRDCMSVSGDSLSRAYDCYATNALKWSIAAGSSCETYWYRCVFANESNTATLGGLASKTSSSLARFEDCVFLPGTTGIHKNFDFTTGVVEIVRSRVGTLTGNVVIQNAPDLTVETSFINVSADTNKTMDFQSCYGKMSMRQRNGGSLTVENCVISGPSTGFTNIFYSNFNPGSGSPHYVRDNIFETATAAAFMSYDATNAGYVVAAGSEFFNNILSGSAAFDADLVTADSGGAVIVDNVTDDALIGAANTLDPADYGYATGSPAIGAGVSGGNCGFSAASPPALPTKPDNQFTCEIDVSDGGTFTLGRTDGLRFIEGDGTADAAMTFVGAIGNINAALAAATIQGLTAGTRTATAMITQDKSGLTDTEILTMTVT